MKKYILSFFVALVMPLLLCGCNDNGNETSKQDETKYIIVSLGNMAYNPHSPVQMTPSIEIVSTDVKFNSTTEAVEYAEKVSSNSYNRWEKRYNEEIKKYNESNDNVARVMAATYYDKMNTLYYVIKMTAPDDLFSDPVEFKKYISDNWSAAMSGDLSEHSQNAEKEQKVTIDIYPISTNLPL